MPHPNRPLRPALVLLCIAPLGSAQAEVLQVAVAANFAAPARQLATQFAQATGHSAQIVSGATGALYAQITQGAPFDVLMAADTSTPERLEREGWAVPGTRRIYARGELVLWSAQHIEGESLAQVLSSPATHKVAIASPKLAPYGAAAQQALTRLGLWQAVQPKLVTGESVGQTFQFIATGNARVGFVARSQLIEAERAQARGEPGLAGITGTTWAMPAGTVGTVDQALVQLKRSANKPAARAWLQFLQTPATRAHIAASGYRVD